MGECLMKGEDYEKSKKEKQDLFLMKMKYHVNNDDPECLTKKELKALLKAKAIKRTRKVIECLMRLGGDSDEEDQTKVMVIDEPSNAS